MKILAKIKKRPYILSILFALLLVGIVYAAEYYQVNSGAQATINEWSVCKKVTNNNALAIFVPTKTEAEWTAFRNNATGISLAECVYYCDEDNDVHYTTTLVSCPSGRTSPTVGDDCNDSCATCYPGSTAYTTSPDGLDQDCDGTVDEILQITCTPIYGTEGVAAWGYNSACQWGYGNTYKYTAPAIPAPTDTTHCKQSGTVCTSSSGGWGTCHKHGISDSSRVVAVDCPVGSGVPWGSAYLASPGIYIYYYHCTPMTGCSLATFYQ